MQSRLSKRSRTLLALGVLILGSQMGHGPGCCTEDIFGPPTETVCPPEGTTLTYENFGQPFMTEYCTNCHSSEKSGADRNGAPSFHDFDTLLGIKAVSDHIDMTAAAGPATINRGMPQDAPFPTDAERYDLGLWIACGMPE